jgi:membrane associated rhomboid family serine protease
VGFQCVECVAEAAKTQRRAIFTGATTPVVTYSLIAVNVAVALASMASNPDWTAGRAGSLDIDYGLIGGGVRFDDGQLRIIGVDNGEWYRIFTGAFLHGGALHLIFNMIALWQCGLFLEDALGRARFALLFLVSLLGGSFGALLLQPDGLTIGASGGVFGLMGALFIAERLGLTGMRSSIGIFLAINLVISFAVPGISVGGHLGGLAAGSLIGWSMFIFHKRQLPPTTPVALAGALAMALFLGCLGAAALWQDPLL